MNYIIWLILGLILGAIFLLYARRYANREEKFIITSGLVLAAIIYVGFALVWGNTTWLGIEIVGILFYAFFAWASIYHANYWLALGWLLHPMWDFGLHLMEAGSTIAPEWYAVACISFDFLVAGYVFWRANYWQNFT